MGTIFPREEKAEQIFEKILQDPYACDRLKKTFFENIPSSEDGDEAGSDIPGNIFAGALFQAYENKDLSAFLMAVCNNSMFDLLRNSFLIPIRFNDKGITNPVIFTDENGKLTNKKVSLIMEKKYQKFYKIYQQMKHFPDLKLYMADGFREKHGYNGEGDIETVRTGEYTGVLQVFSLPEYVEKNVQDTTVYRIVWSSLMQLQQMLPRAIMYYGVMDQTGQEKHTSKLGIFLPFSHFEHEMDKKLEEAAEIGFECQKKIIEETKREELCFQKK